MAGGVEEEEGREGGSTELITPAIRVDIWKRKKNRPANRVAECLCCSKYTTETEPLILI